MRQYGGRVPRSCAHGPETSRLPAVMCFWTLRGNIVLLHVMPEGAIGHTEEFGGFDLNAVCAAKSFFEESFLEIFHEGLEIEPLVGEIRHRAHPRSGRDAFGKMLRGELEIGRASCRERVKGG